MSTDQRFLTGQQFTASDGVQDWRVLARTAAAWFAADSHAAGARMARQVAAVTGPAQTPDVDLRSTGLQVRLPRAEKGFDPAVIDLARAISAAAHDLGLRPDPSVVQDVQLTFDTLDRSAVMPFWAAALGYEPEGEEDSVDPLRRRPAIWWQEQDEPRPLRGRIHLDSVAPWPVATAAVQAARELGASTVTEHGYYATVADAEGNEVDLLPLLEGHDRWAGPGTEDWRLVFAAMACYPTTSPDAAAQLAEDIALLADDAALPLAIDLRPGLLVVDTGKDRWEMEEGYEVLAARVQQAARAAGLRADTTLARFAQIGIDAVDIPAARRFWCAVLGYEKDPRPDVTDIVDPHQLNAVLFFQNLDENDSARRAQRNRIHVDVFLPHDRVRARLDAGLAAGGQVVRDRSPFWWTLADPEGNEVDLCVAVGREEAWGG